MSANSPGTSTQSFFFKTCHNFIFSQPHSALKAFQTHVPNSANSCSHQVLKRHCNSFFLIRSFFTCCLRSPGCPVAPPAAGCRLARLGCRECDALRVQVVHELGGTEPDPGCFESLLELGEDQRLVLEDLVVQPGVGQDEGAHGLEPILKAVRSLRGGDATVAVGVAIGREAQLWVGPDNREERGHRATQTISYLCDTFSCSVAPTEHEPNQ